MHNAVQQSSKELQTRFDFKGSKASVQLDPKAWTITLLAEDEHRLRNVLDLVQQRLAKRGVPVRALQVDKPSAAADSMLRQVIRLQNGIPAEKAKQIQRALRDQQLKITAQVQGDQLRVFGPKKDDLQAAIRFLKEQDFGLDLQFENYR